MSRTAFQAPLDAADRPATGAAPRPSRDRAPGGSIRYVFTLRRIRAGVWADIPETPVFPTEGKALDWARHNGAVLKPEKGDGFNVFRVVQASGDAVLTAA